MDYFSIDVVTGPMSRQHVNCAMNSAGALPFAMGSGTAADLRDAGGTCSDDDVGYKYISEKVKESNPVIGQVVDYVNKKRPHVYKAQKARLEAVLMNGSKKFEKGDAIMFPSFDLSRKEGCAKYVCDMIATDYDWEAKPVPTVIKPAFNSIMDSLYNSLMLAADLNCRTVGVPPVGRRKAGLTKEQSMDPMIEAIKKFGRKKTSVEKISIVLYSEEFYPELQWHKDYVEEKLT